MREEYRVMGIGDLAKGDAELRELWNTLARMGHEYYETVPTTFDSGVKFKSERTLEQRLESTLDKFLKTPHLIQRIEAAREKLENLAEKKMALLQGDVDSKAAEKKPEKSKAPKVFQSKKKSLAAQEYETERQGIENLLQEQVNKFEKERNNVWEIIGKLIGRHREQMVEKQSQGDKAEAATNRKLELFQDILKDISDKKVLADVIGKFTRFIHQAHKAEVEMPTIKQVREFVSAVNKDASNVKKLWESCFAIPAKSSEENVVEKSGVKTRLTPRGTAGD